MGFPAGCIRESCVRLMLRNDSSHHAKGLTVPAFHNTEDEIMMAVNVCFLIFSDLFFQSWLDEWDETTRLVAKNATYVHYRFITIFFGFTDDFYVIVVPSGFNSSLAVEVQSESRMGFKDFGM